MTLLLDAQLPLRLAHWLADRRHDAIHTLDLPQGSATPDDHLSRIADEAGRILATKDADFVASHILTGTPARLWLISMGNLSNRRLEAIVARHLVDVEIAFAEAMLVEMTRDRLWVRR